eukprot:g7742.t1
MVGSQPQSQQLHQLPPVVKEEFRHGASNYRFVVYQSPMLESEKADQLATAAGMWPHPCMLFDAHLKVFDGFDRLVLDINTADVLRGASRRPHEIVLGSTPTTATSSSTSETPQPEKMQVEGSCSPEVEDNSSGDTTTSTTFQHAAHAYLLAAKVKCQHAERWGESRENSDNKEIAGLKPVHTHTDWTFSTTYCPTPLCCSAKRQTTAQSRLPEAPPEAPDQIQPSLLPLHLLTSRSDPIQFFSQVSFFEDELDDEGSSACFVKIRVQENFFFVLLSNEVRVDNVLARKVETRLFGNLMMGSEGSRETTTTKTTDLGSLELQQQLSTDGGPAEVAGEVLRPREILREWSFLECSFEELRKRGDLTGVEQISETIGMLDARKGDLKCRHVELLSTDVDQAPTVK